MVVALGCNHSDPFQVGPQDPRGPLRSFFPRRVTDGETSIIPMRAAGGRGWLYSYAVVTSPIITDLCVAGLPLQGGGQTRTYCDVTFGRSAMNSTITWAAEREDGRMAYVRNRGFPDGGATFDGSLVLGSFAPRDSGIRLRQFPYTTAHGFVHGMTHLAWLTGHQLIFVATRLDRLGPTSLDSVESGLQIERLDADHPPTTPDVFPNTELASSVDPTPDGRAFYYTINGQSMVLRRTIATGATDTVFDFGALGIARDVRVSDSVLYAIVGGSVSLRLADSLVPGSTELVQSDQGGTLMRVDLTSGRLDSLLVFNDPLRHPVLSEGRKFILVQGRSRTLWLLEAP